MARSQFENLQVFQLAEQLADEVWKIVFRWQVLARDTVGKQLVRAADSVGANIAEGAGRGSFQDNRRFVRISRGSLYEARFWLRRAFRRQLLTDEQVKVVKSLLDNLCPMLNGYLKSIGPRPTKPPEGPGRVLATDYGLRTTDSDRREG